MRLILFILTILFSLLWIYFIPNEPVSDPTVYFRTAADLAAGKGYVDESGNPWGYWAPGYSFYLAIFFKLFGTSNQVAFFANWIAYISLIIGVYYLCSNLYGSKVGQLAAILTAIYPTFILFNTILASEILYNALTVWGVYLLWRGYDNSGNLFWMIAASALIACAMIVRNQGLLLPLLCIPIIKIRQFPMAKGLMYMILIATLSIGLCVPWGIRNYKAFGKFVLISANFGANLWIGNHDGAEGGYLDPTEFIQSEGIAHLSLAERDEYLKNKAFEFIQENPIKYFQLIFKRFFITMRGESIGVVWNKIGLERIFGKESIWFFKVLINFCYLVFLLFFLYSLYATLFRSSFEQQDLLIFSALLLSLIPFLLIIGQDRYHLPLVPFMIILIAKTFEKRRFI